MNSHYKEAEIILIQVSTLLKRFVEEDISSLNPTVLDSSIMKLIKAKCEMTIGDKEWTKQK